MGAIINALFRLQKVDRELATLRSKEESFRRLARAGAKQLEKQDAQRQAHMAEITRCQVEIDNTDLEIKSHEESVNRHRQALNTAKSNKEYAAILTALNTEKADSSKRESRVLELMSRLDELRSEAKKFDEEKQKIQQRIRRHEEDLAAYLEEHREDYQRLESERQEAAENVPYSVLQSFERIAAHHDGEAVAEVVRLSSRGHDYVCGGCNMSMPLELVNKLRSRDEVQVCNCCGRILHIDQQTGVGA